MDESTAITSGVTGRVESRLDDLYDNLLYDEFKDPDLVRGIAIHLLGQRNYAEKQIDRAAKQIHEFRRKCDPREDVVLVTPFEMAYGD